MYLTFIPTFSSEPSWQSSSPSQSHSFCKHSWVCGHRSCVRQRGGLEQCSSSEPSLQSAYPSHLSASDTHWPLTHRYWWSAQDTKPGKRKINVDVISRLHALLFWNFWKAPTAVFLIWPISTISLSITQEALWYAASIIITALMAALNHNWAVSFIRLVQTVILPVTHSLLWEAFFPMGTLELTWERERPFSFKIIRHVSCH